MDIAVYKALSGAILQLRRLEAATQNLANVNTAGYKRDALAFGEVLGRVFAARGRAGGFVALAEQRADLSQGPIRHTGDPFHLALEGEGFFAVQTPRGVRYTRHGAFTLSGGGAIVTAAGYPLLGEGGPIRVEGRFEVGPDGVVVANGQEIDRLRIASFDAGGVEKSGDSLFAPAPGIAPRPASARVVQGSLEDANVNAVEAMVTLIRIQREFEAYQKALRAMDAATERMLAEGARV
jgi:flagellar basal-body rod protein FlgF